MSAARDLFLNFTCRRFDQVPDPSGGNNLRLCRLTNKLF
jgi:hypothetical protein